MKRFFTRFTATSAIVILLATAGCSTQLISVRVEPPAVGEDPKIPVAGIPYFLAFTQYKIKVTHRLTDCWNSDDQPTLVITSKAEVATAEAPDPERTYVIDIDKLGSFFKATDLTVEYYGPMQIKSINASIEDKAGPFIASVFTSVAKVGAVALSAGGPGDKSRKGDGGCLHGIPAKLKDIKTREEALKKKTKEIAATTKELNDLTELAKVMGKTFPLSEKQKHGQVYSLLKRQQAAFEKETDELDALLEEFTVSSSTTWPTNGNTFQSTKPIIGGIDPKVLGKWGSAEKWGYPYKFQEQTAVWAKLSSPNPLARVKPCNTDCFKNDAAMGFKYRMAVAGTLTLFLKTVDKDNKETNETIGTNDGPINQLGSVFTLPLKSTLFSNKSIVAEFDKTGVVTKLGVKSSAASDVAATTLSAIADQAIKLKEAKDNKELNQLNDEIAIIKAKKEKDELEKIKEPDKYADKKAETEAYNVDKALLEAHLAVIKATKALEEASLQGSP